MSSDPMELGWPAEIASPPMVTRLHGWVTTVDHKRLGILYILYALVFLVLGGIEATVMRIQLVIPHNDFVSPAGVQPDVHDAWNHHDFFRGHADRVRLRQLS